MRRLENHIRLLDRSLRQTEAENARLTSGAQLAGSFVPPGHYYSPLPSRQDIAGVYDRGGFGPPFPAIDLNEAGQLELARRLAEHYPSQPFSAQPRPGRRFHLENPAYGQYDAIILYCMLRHLRPARIIEIGSGHSSAAMLDINALALGGRTRLTFVDPDMARLRPMLQPEDLAQVTLIERPVQELPLSVFAELGPNDVLFIDSSHVSKVGSDVNRLFFEVLPSLRPGVWVHVHDIPLTLEYSREWLEEGRAWNEAYLLRAFLMYNRAFRVELFTPWLINFHRGFVRERMPACAVGGGAQLWLSRQPGEGGPP